MTADFLTDDEIDHFAQSLEDFNFEKPDSSEHSNHENYREPRNPKVPFIYYVSTFIPQKQIFKCDVLAIALLRI